MSNYVKIIILVIVLSFIFGVIMYFDATKPKRVYNLKGEPVKTNDTQRVQIKLHNDKYKLAREIALPAGYINTDEIKLQDMIGKKVILLDFWTYSCINCQRTFPYLTSWYEKYKDQGLEIVGVHTPEFFFEHKKANVEKAVERYNIKYPVVLDNEYGTWSAYGNNYWPRKYLIDIDGFIVYNHIGEGGYTETEKKIQEALAERKEVLSENIEIKSDIVKPSNIEAVDLFKRRSPEIYFGASRNQTLGNGLANRIGVQMFMEPKEINNDILYLEGEWDIQSEYAKNTKVKSKIIFKYRADKVFVVARADSEIEIIIKRDGELVGDYGGKDVVDNKVKIKEDRLYRIIDEIDGHSEHVLEIIVSDPGLEVFTFTFG